MMKLVAKEGCCEEASTMSREFYIPCNRPAVDLLYSDRDKREYRMCEMCSHHNVGRGMKVIKRGSMEKQIVEMKFGSHLYGLNTPESDVDFKNIFLPNMRNILLNDYKPIQKMSTGSESEKNKAGDIDIDKIALPKFLKLACSGETFTIDMLHCTDPIQTSDIWEELVANRTSFYSKDMKAYFGYVKRQAAKYGIKGSRVDALRKALGCLGYLYESYTLDEVEDHLYVGDHVHFTLATNRGHEQRFYEVNGVKYQTSLSVFYVREQLKTKLEQVGDRSLLAEKNKGVDWKAVSHALRAAYQVRDIYKDGDFEYPLKETPFLKEVKLGKLDFFKEVAPELESLTKEIEILCENSKLPQSVDTKFWDDWLIDIYYKELG